MMRAENLALVRRHAKTIAAAFEAGAYVRIAEGFLEELLDAARREGAAAEYRGEEVVRGDDARRVVSVEELEVRVAGDSTFSDKFGRLCNGPTLEEAVEALEAIADGEGEAQVIARQTLDRVGRD